MVVWVFVDEVGREGAERSNRAFAGSEIIEHPAHQPVGHALAAHCGVGLHMRDGQHRPVEHIVGHRDDATINDQLVSPTIRVIAHMELGGGGVWHAVSVP